MQPIKTALVGFGISGQCFQAPVIESVDTLDLCAVVSINPAKVAEHLPDATVYPTLDQLLAESDVELVVVATPNGQHYPMAKAALKAGKHVVVEKPFVIHSEQGQELIELASEKNLKLTVYHSRRFDADFFTIKALIEQGKLGQVHTLISHYDRFRPEVKDRWRERDEPGAGILYDLGAHLIDQAVALFGTPESVSARLRNQRPGAQAVDHFHLVLSYRQLDVIVHGNNLTVAPGPRFQVFGDQGSFIKYGMDPQEDMLREGKQPGSPGWGEEAQSAFGTLQTVTDSGDQIHEQVPSIPGAYQDFYLQMASAIRQGTALPVPADEALTVVRIIEAAYRSEQEGKHISLETETA